MGPRVLRNPEVAGQHVPKYWSDVLLVRGEKSELQDPYRFQRLHTGAFVEQTGPLEKELCVCLRASQQTELATGIRGYTLPFKAYNDPCRSQHYVKAGEGVSRDTF